MENSNKNHDDLQKMQQDAIKRVQEMQLRAKRNLSASQNQNNQYHRHLQQSRQPFSHNIQEKQESIEEKKEPNSNIKKVNKSRKLKLKRNKSKSLVQLLDVITKDSDKTIILLLIIILLEEGSDNILILALLYLLI